MQFNPKALILTVASLAILWIAIEWQFSVFGIVVSAFLWTGLLMYFSDAWPTRYRLRNVLGPTSSRVTSFRPLGCYSRQWYRIGLD